MSSDLRALSTRLYRETETCLQYLELAEALDEMRTDSNFASSEHIRQAASIAKALAAPSWRVFVYKTAIVQLYGMHERFMRELSDALAETISRAYANYDELPEAIRNSHLRLSLENFQTIMRSKAADDPIVQLRSAMSSLVGCLSGSVALTKDAMRSHGANFRHDMVRELVSRYAVEIPKWSGDTY